MNHQNTHPFDLCMPQYTPQTKTTGLGRTRPSVKVTHHVTIILFENDRLAPNRGIKEDNLLGIFRVPAKMRNWQNRFLPPGKQGREVSCDMLVDSRAAELALPAELIDPLKLEDLGAMRVVTADGGQRECRVLGMVELEVHSGTSMSGQSH